ncbi:MAG: hypothetical protein AB7P69_28185 [Candidatus Binatia bacterium]
MSTILDALRKLEEEHHSRTADARSRLLLSLSHQTRPLQLRRSFWKANGNLLSIMGLLVAGFSAGAGFVFWRSYSSQTSPAAPRVVASSPPQSDMRPDSSSAPLQSASETFPAEQESDSPPFVTSTTASLPLPYSPPEEQNTTPAGASAVQRSPFAATPPASWEMASTQREITPVAKHAPAPTPSIVDETEQDGSRYEVLLPSGATRTVKSFSPPPSTTTAPTTPSGTVLSFLQWSSDPDRRIAFIRVNGGPLTMAHEGDTIGGYTVIEIRQNAVELQSGEARMTLRPH